MHTAYKYSKKRIIFSFDGWLFSETFEPGADIFVDRPHKITPAQTAARVNLCSERVSYARAAAGYSILIGKFTRGARPPRPRRVQIHDRLVKNRKSAKRIHAQVLDIAE